MKTNYTKGEWFPVSYAGHWIIQDGEMYEDGNLLDDLHFKEAEYNAKLAAAAPDLLDACIEALNYMDDDGFKPIRTELKQAIKKATE